MLGILLTGFFVPGGAYAEVEELKDLEAPGFNENIEEWEFTEDAVNLPDYPNFDNLLKVRIDASGGLFDYSIDPDSLSIGRDGVVLVTVVISSSRGARNVVFEGYRCDTREYKTFAYGTSSNSFYSLPDSQWKEILRVTGSSQDYRRELVTTYLCSIYRQALPREEILRLIKYPSFRNDDGRMF